MKQKLVYTSRKNGNYTYLFSLLGLLIAIAFASCKKNPVQPPPPPPPPPTYHLNVSPASIQSPATGITGNVSIEANAAWKVTPAAGVDWVEINKTSGDGNDNIQVKVIKENTTGVKRTATITVELLNGKAPAKQISVEQDFAIAQPVNIIWKKLLGGSGNDYGYSIIKSPDGGYLLSGRTTSNNNGDVGPTKGGIDMWVAKLNAAGEISWAKTYGGNSDEYSVAAAATPDGGYVLTGFTLSNNNGDVGPNHGNTDFWVVKLNASGTILWQKVLGGGVDDRPNAITVTTEGKIAVAGYTNSSNTGDVGQNHGAEDFWVVMLDNTNGNVIWKKTYGGNGSEMARAIIPAPDGGLFVGGSSNSVNNGDPGPGKGGYDMWILRLTKEGAITWQNRLGGTNAEELYALAAGPNNTLVAAGSTKSSNGDVSNPKGSEDIWVLQLNANTGSLNWQKVLGGDAIDVARGVLVKPNGTIVVAGYSYSNNTGDVGVPNGAGDYLAIGLNSTGNIIWKKLLGGSDEDLAWAIADSGDGGFAISGSTLSKNSGDIGPGKGNSDIWVVKLKDE